MAFMNNNSIFWKKQLQWHRTTDPWAIVGMFENRSRQSKRESLKNHLHLKMQSCSFQQNILHRGSIWKRHSHVFVWKRKIKHVCLQCHPLGLIIGTIYLIVSELWCYSISRAEGSWSKLNDQSNVAFSMNRPWINMTLLFSCNGPGFHPESFHMCVSKMSAASWEQRSYKNGQERGHLFIILNSVIIMLQHHIIPMILFVDVCICVCETERNLPAQRKCANTGRQVRSPPGPEL